MSVDVEQQRSLEFGETAVKHLKTQVLAATPRNYEVWYAYASGQDERITAALNNTMESDQPITQAVIDKLFDEFIAPHKRAEKIEGLGGHLSRQVETVASTIDEAAGVACEFSHDLGAVALKLSSAPDVQTMRLVLEQVVMASRSAEMQNHVMKQKLQVSIHELNSIHQRIGEVINEASIDSLTGLFNRKYYNEVVLKEIKKASKLGRPLTLLVIDIDKFKRFNDTYGHLTGDQILRLLGAVLKQNVRMQDIACRLGGEEFVLLLLDTPLHAALVVAENIRRLVMAKELVRKSTNEVIGRVTVSIGVASLGKNDTSSSLFERADQCLYAAKRSGRNKVVAENDPEFRASAEVA